jgi:predicted amidophosphoribosyltransferase
MSRLTLYWFNLTKREGKDTLLKIPLCAVYSVIIDRAFPDLDRIPWQSAEEGRCYTYLKNLSEGDFDKLNNFLDKLHHVLLLTPSEHLKLHFSDELTECYALDYNYQQNVIPRAYTQTGQAEHDAKWNRDGNAVEWLGRRIWQVIESHPTLAGVDFVAAVPPRPSKTYHLPSQLLARVAPLLGRPTLQTFTKAEHRKLKDLPFEEKLSELNGKFALTENIKDKRILLLDDMYQSGVTAWSVAKFLKQQGAREVYALACVKSWSDTDNV